MRRATHGLTPAEACPRKAPPRGNAGVNELMRGASEQPAADRSRTTGGYDMVMVARGVVDACLLTRDGIVRCQLDAAGQRGEVVNALLPGENIRAIVSDPLSPNRL